MTDDGHIEGELPLANMLGGGATLPQLPIEHLTASDFHLGPLHRLVDEIVAKPDARLWGVICVSMRSATDYRILDGVQRVEAMRRLGHRTVLCFVLVGLTPREEARRYTEIRGWRRPIGEVVDERPAALRWLSDDPPSEEIQRGECPACGVWSKIGEPVHTPDCPIA